VPRGYWLKKRYQQHIASLAKLEEPERLIAIEKSANAPIQLHATSTTVNYLGPNEDEVSKSS